MVHDHRQLWRDLKRENAVLRGQLAAAGMAAVDEGVRLPELTPQQAMIVGVLLNAHPKVVERYALDAELPVVKAKNGERDIAYLDAQMHRIRRVLGKEAIEGVYGVGFRMSDATAAMLRGPNSPGTRKVWVGAK